ncbi:hypothetical protein GQX73_g451 [Xylaria multiplex]|uniref:BZIP domain-containing protein n=1 Tax=Xylaria multiplex TaxID=323545 RepID=A0A7C8IXJ8_9PEZI|nr:hypothetical protein GQX73_g451 [Xylaria multiplex]
MDEDWSEVSDATVRKRIQNRLAQRKHRMKAQEQANKSAKNSSPVISQSQITAPEECFFSQSFVSPMEASAGDSRGHDNGTTGEPGCNDFTSTGPGHPGHRAFFMGSSWNHSVADNNGGDGTSQTGEILDNSWKDIGHTGLPRVEQQRRGVNSVAMAPDSDAGTLDNTKQNPYGQYITSKTNPIPLQTMAYSDENQCLEHFNPNSPLANTFSSSNGRKRGSTAPDSGSTTDTDHCLECSHHKRHRGGRSNSLVANDYSGSQGLLSSSYPSTQGVGGLISPVHTPTSSSIMRDHGIDLNQLIPRVNAQLRESTPATLTKRGPTQVSSPKRRFSETSIVNQCSHDHHRAVACSHRPEKDHYETQVIGKGLFSAGTDLAKTRLPSARVVVYNDKLCDAPAKDDVYAQLSHLNGAQSLATRVSRTMKHQVRALCLVAASAIGVNGVRPFGSSFGIPGNDATYDYVVVGGGTAGLTVASRLVEQRAGTVAVIEAGTFYEISTGNNSEVPANTFAWAGKLSTDWQPLADWGYETVPQAGAFNAKLRYPRGKMLGGSSARNFMIYHRGTEGSYQKWADIVGDDSYTFDKFLPFFEKSVNFTPPNTELRLQNATPEYDLTVLGNGEGSLGLSYPNWAYAFPTWATKAFAQMGLPLRPDGFNSGGLNGHAYATFTIDGKTMIRASSETAFLQNSLGNPDYFVYPLTDAKRVLFDRTKRATGVRVDTAGRQYTISARKEVIMAAGAIGSPQLLQVSGVGPAKLLKSHNINVVADLPGVGQGMQDHVVFGISQGVNVVTASNLAGDAAFAQEQAQLYVEKAAGLLTSPAADMLAWEKLPNNSRSALSNSTRAVLASEYPADWPELEYIAFSSWYGNASLLTADDPMDGVPYSTMGVALITPRSRGSVNIVSSDASVPPAIDPRFLTDRADIEVVVAGFKRAREFYRQSSLKGLLVGPEAYPGNSVQTDAQIEAHIRRNFNTVYHGSCTCAMGRRSDPKAVVDTQGRVYGVKGLRVVDASAFPLLPPGHPESTVYALAEKLACDISGNCS